MKVRDLSSGELLQFVPGSGPIPYDEAIADFPAKRNSELHTARHFNWTWEEGMLPRHMIYVGSRREKGKLIYEVLWNDHLRTISGYCIKHLERVDGSEGIQVDGRASSTA